MCSRRALFIPLVFALGCGTRETPSSPNYSSERARGALVATLDAWKKGEAKGLSKRKPPIRFVDDDFVSGMKLMEFAIAEIDAPIVKHKDVNVMLSLQSARGKTVRRDY